MFSTWFCHALCTEPRLKPRAESIEHPLKTFLPIFGSRIAGLEKIQNSTIPEPTIVLINAVRESTDLSLKMCLVGVVPCGCHHLR